MPLLTNQLVLFQHHVTSVPQSAGWVRVTWPRHGHSSGRTSPAHWFLSMPFSAPPPTLTPNQQAAHLTFLTNQRVLRSQMSTLQPTSNSLRLTNKSRKNPLQPAPIRKPTNQPAASGLPFSVKSCLPGRHSISPSPFLACWKPKD